MGFLCPDRGMRCPRLRRAVGVSGGWPRWTRPLPRTDRDPGRDVLKGRPRGPRLALLALPVAQRPEELPPGRGERVGHLPFAAGNDHSSGGQDDNHSAHACDLARTGRSTVAGGVSGAVLRARRVGAVHIHGRAAWAVVPDQRAEGVGGVHRARRRTGPGSRRGARAGGAERRRRRREVGAGRAPAGGLGLSRRLALRRARRTLSGGGRRQPLHGDTANTAPRCSPSGRRRACGSIAGRAERVARLACSALAIPNCFHHAAAPP